MNNNCINLKQGFNKLKCKRTNKEITFTDCNNCKYKEYKERKPIKTTKPIKKVSKRRVTVTKQTYESVYTRDNGRCALCHSNELIQLHHIRGRGKHLTNDINNCIMLCFDCHHNKVHKNNKYYRKILLNMVGGDNK